MMMQLSSRPCHGTPLLHLHLLRLTFLALDANGGERVEYDRDRGACEWVDYFVCYFIMHRVYLSCICEIFVLVRYFFYGCES